MTSRIRRSPRLTRAGVAIALAWPTSTVLADESPHEKSLWQITVGAGAVNMPEYPGSENTQTRALPMVSVRYGRFFLGGAPGSGSPAGLGAYLYEDETWGLGAVVSRDAIDPRDESDDARLRGLGDIDATTRAGLFANYHISWLTLRASALTDLADKAQGTIANFDAEATYRPFPQLILSAGPGVTWANEEYMRTFFGVSREQAARSAFTPYSPGSGASLVRLLCWRAVPAVGSLEHRRPNHRRALDW